MDRLATGIGRRRAARAGMTIAVIGALLLPLGASWRANAQEGKLTKPLTWEDAPLTLLHRSEADWLIDVGWKTSDDLYGPISTRDYEAGDAERFIPLGGFASGPETFFMAYRSERAYFWFQRGLRPNRDDLERSARFFEDHIYPLNTAVFGEAATPGIDGDSRFHIVNQEFIGAGVMGAFNPEDQCPRSLCPDSNQRDIIYVNLNAAPLGSDQYLTTLAHEHQHLIQFTVDGNERRWFNEALAQLAEHLNGFRPRLIGDLNVIDFLSKPDHDLNGWSDSREIGSYYGAGYLFMVYLYERFGLDFIRLIARSDYDGLASIEEALRASGQDVSLNDVFADWIVANYLDDPYAGNGRYYFQTLNLPSRILPIPLPVYAWGYQHTDTANQYGADYLSIDPPGSYNLSFDGSDETPIVGAMPHSGDWMWWSYDDSSSATRLTGAFDLTGLDTATLVFSAWWNTEDEFDWLQVLVSDDGGQTWQIVAGELASPRGPHAPGANYTGESATWIDERVDLSAYAGSRVVVRFEYLTDGSTTLPGVALDDIGILELGGLDDGENLVSVWQSEGFMRVSGTTRQSWTVTAVAKDATGRVTVQPVLLDTLNTGRITITVPEGGRATIIVGAMAPFATQQADYKLSIQRAG
jgi:hypothetical protein